MKGFIILISCFQLIFAVPQYHYNPPNQGNGLGPITTGPSGGDEQLGGGLIDVRGGNIAAGPSFSQSYFGTGSSHSQHNVYSNKGHNTAHTAQFPKGSGGFIPSVGGFSQGNYAANSGQSGGGYNSGHLGGNIGGGHFSGGNIGGGHSGGGSFGGGNLGGGHSGGLISGGFGGFGGSSGGGSHGGISGGHAAHQTIVTKQFFIHSAPEEQDAVGDDKVINLGPGRKHYRVVFIKAPHQGIQSGKVRFVAPANEEKTVIYVLSKKTDLADIAADVQQAHSEPTKPDVLFIKYKTPEEAIHAQRQIQAQYDQLGGTSQISDEGVAPISSVIGALGNAGGSHHSSQQSGHQGGFTSSGNTGPGFAAPIGSTGAGISNIGGNSIDNGHIGTGAGATYLPPHH